MQGRNQDESNGSQVTSCCIRSERDTFIIQENIKLRDRSRRKGPPASPNTETLQRVARYARDYASLRDSDELPKNRNSQIIFHRSCRIARIWAVACNAQVLQALCASAPGKND